MNQRLLDTCQALNQNGFDAIYAEDRIEARQRILGLIPKGSLVGIGDSISVRQLDVLAPLEQGGRILIDLFSRTISELTGAREITMKERSRIARMALFCQYFVTGTNVLTEDGRLVNIDGHANRVAGMMFGPEHAVLIAGRNKLVPNLDAAFHRLKHVIVPDLARTKRKNTPCAVTGHCTDCRSPERMCGVTTIIERPGSYIETHVVVVNEDLGLGWDPEWPADRVNAIRRAYQSLTWLKLGTRAAPPEDV